MCFSSKWNVQFLYKKRNIVALIRRSIFCWFLSHVASNSRHIRIFCDSIWNILHNAFVSEHQLLMLAECITSLLLVTLIFKHGVKEHAGINIFWMVHDIFARRDRLSTSAANCLWLLLTSNSVADRRRLNSRFYSFSFSWLAYNPSIKEIRFKTLF